MDDSDYMKIAENIRYYRKLHRMTQAQMAVELDVDRQYYSSLEQGIRHFTLDKIATCCGIFGVDMNSLVPEETYKKVLNDADREEVIKRINSLISSTSTGRLVFLERILEDIKML